MGSRIHSPIIYWRCGRMSVTNRLPINIDTSTFEATVGGTRSVVANQRFPTWNSGDGAFVVMTIGYGSEAFESLLRRLKDVGINWVVDVRSRPHSKYRPEYSSAVLADKLRRDGIGYLFMGDQLGGRPDDPTCYDHLGHVRYDFIASKPAFVESLSRIETGTRHGYRIALLCSEARPEVCHRTKLIAENLRQRGVVAVRHIDPDGTICDHETVIRRIDGGQQSLGFDDTLITSVGAYHHDGSRI